MKQKADWLKQAGKVEIEDFLGQKVEELNKEAKIMNLLQKDEAEKTEVVAEVEAVSTEQQSNTTVVKENSEEPKFLTKEEVADTFVDLLKPMVEVNETLVKEVADLKSLVSDLQNKLNTLQKEAKETVNEQAPLASLTALVKERLYSALNKEVNPSLTEEFKNELKENKPAVKVEKEVSNPHILAGFVEGN